MPNARRSWNRLTPKRQSEAITNRKITAMVMNGIPGSFIKEDLSSPCGGNPGYYIGVVRNDHDAVAFNGEETTIDAHFDPVAF